MSALTWQKTHGVFEPITVPWVSHGETIRASSDVALWCQIGINPLCTSIFFQRNMKQKVSDPSHDCWIRKPMIPWSSDTWVKVSNWQIMSHPGLCSPQRGANAAAAATTVWLSLPARSDNSRCEMHRARKSAYASSPGQGWARQLKPGPIPFHFHCLCNWVRPAASQTEHPVTSTVRVPPQKQHRG